jgi:excisionase family DNA binding protein
VEIYKVQQIAEMFGVKVRTVQEWIRKHELPASKIGKAYFSTEADITEFLNRKKVGKNED